MLLKKGIFFCSLFVTLEARYLEPAVTGVIWLKRLHSAHPALSDVDTFIRWAFLFNATLQPREDGRQNDYYPDFGLSRQVVYSHKLVKSPQEGHVLFKHRLLIFDSHASHLLV